MAKNWKNRTRKVCKRNIALSIVYSILTLGLYWLFWQYEIAKETEALTNHKCKIKPSLVVFVSIITLGIYGVYWSFKTGQKHDSYFKEKGIKTDYQSKFLVLQILNYFIPILGFIVFGMMQNNMNKIIADKEKEQQEITVEDNSMFNKPILSVFALGFVAKIATSYPQSILDAFFSGAQANPTGNVNDFSQMDNFVYDMAKTYTGQMGLANTPYVIAHTIVTIAGIIACLWWFKMRFKHCNYTGVLCFKNMGCGFLILAPLVLWLCINCMHVNLDNFSIGLVLLGFMPGIVEEIEVRGLLLPNFMRILDKKYCVYVALIIPTLLICIIHIGNIFVGGDPIMTVVQIYYAFALGLTFAASILRSGTILPSMIVHSLIFTTAFMSDSAQQSGVFQTAAFDTNWAILVFMIFCAVLIGYSLWLCRPKKHAEIISLWKEKWGSATIN